VSNIPPAIDKWVVKSAEEGQGGVAAQASRHLRPRFIFSLLPMVFNAYGSFKKYQEERMFDQAKAYDTKIYYQEGRAGRDL